MSKGPARIHELRELLTRANRAYYVDASPIMPDLEFDKLLAELADLEAKHPDLADPDSPTRRVGGEPIDGFTQVKHAVPMLSIDNSYDESEVREWTARVLRGLKDAGLFGGSVIRYVAEPKIDGVALALRYEHGKLIHAVTRGDGLTGDDVMHAARVIPAIPLQLAGPAPKVLEIRGEVFMTSKRFAAINQELEDAGEDLLANPRNATVGTIKNLDPKLIARRKLSFIAHGRGEVSPGFASSHSEFLVSIKKLGVPVSPHLVLCKSVDEILHAIQAFAEARRELDYATDGMVVRVDRFDQQEELGLTSKSPRWAIAYKYPPDRKPTILLDVLHQVGKTGKITPRAVMEPVHLAGTTVKHATLHNYGQIRQKDIRLGDTIEVEKAGEVIPYVVGVVLAKRPKTAKPVPVPETCPECGVPVDFEYDRSRVVEIQRWEKLPYLITSTIDRLESTKAALQTNPNDPAAFSELIRLQDKLESAYAARRKGPPPPLSPLDESSRFCMNPECPKQIREKLIWFCGRRQMNIEGIGESTIDAIRKSGQVPLNTFADLFSLPKHWMLLVSIPGIGNTKLAQFAKSIEEAKHRGLARLLSGMGIRHVGETIAKRLARRFRDVDSLLSASLRELMPLAKLSAAKAKELGIPADPVGGVPTGLGAESAVPVFHYLHSEPAVRTFASLRSLGVDLTSKNHVEDEVDHSSTMTAFAGKRIVVTGTLLNFKREELEDRLSRLGAHVSGSVSSKTNLLIAGASPGSKLAKAEQFKVEIWDENRLLRELDGLEP